MSNAKRCDRCGEYYEPMSKNLHGTNTGSVPKYSIKYHKHVSKTGVSVESFDLCPECAQQLADWIEDPDRVKDRDSIVISNNKHDNIIIILASILIIVSITCRIIF